VIVIVPPLDELELEELELLELEDVELLEELELLELEEVELLLEELELLELEEVDLRLESESWHAASTSTPSSGSHGRDLRIDGALRRSEICVVFIGFFPAVSDRLSGCRKAAAPGSAEQRGAESDPPFGSRPVWAFNLALPVGRANPPNGGFLRAHGPTAAQEP